WLLNLALFDTNVHGFQTVTFNGVSFDITNQNLVSRGFEVESSWNPVRGLRLYANGTYADAKDRDSGRRVPLAPKIQGSAGFNYKTALT
ncbi:TonB-dependent receptor domain-containing protein, partial [Streptomyces galilaeus]|uniref:TonB-dependent receptor domain-containing protein n=1 Tax=Streptomyces galilaeus TaxID=33899 RepID=UPI0038F7F6F7